MQGKTASVVENALKETIQNLGFDLYEVEYVKKQNGMNLTLFITNKNRPITIEDCELVHRTVDPILDEVNPTGDASYYLNVSSVGLDRPLKTDKDFNRCLNKEVVVKLYSGTQKELVGVIQSFTDKDLILLISGNEVLVPRQNIALCKQNITF